MVADFDLKSGSVVLDLGCGPGLWSPMLADEVKPKGKVIGIDFSTAIIDYANNNLENEPLKDMIEFKGGDFYDIPFEDNTLTQCFLEIVLHTLPSPQKLDCTFLTGHKLSYTC